MRGLWRGVLIFLFYVGGIDFFPSVLSKHKGSKRFEGIFVSYGRVILDSIGFAEVSMYAGS